MNKYPLIGKAFVVGIILLFVGAGIIPSLAKNISEKSSLILSRGGNHEPIYIDGNDDFTSENGVTGGNGSQDNPYIISGLYFDGSYQYRLDEIRWKNKIFEFIINYFFGELEIALTIANTDKHVIIRDNIFVNWNEPKPPQDPHDEETRLPNHKAMKLSKTENITITDNHFTDCNEGIDCYDSDVMIRGNEFINIDGGYQIIYLAHQRYSIIEQNMFQSCECRHGIHLFLVKQDTIIRSNTFQNCYLSEGAVDFVESPTLVYVTDNEFTQMKSYTIIGTNGWIENNTVSDCEIAIKVQDSIIYNNLIQSSWIGIGALGYYEIYHNDIVGNGIGIGVYDAANPNSTVFKNDVTRNKKGVYCVNTTLPSIFYNNIYDNTNGMENNAEQFLLAIQNWWGASNGPGGQGPGDGNSIRGNIEFDPWLLTPVVDAGRLP